MKKQCPVSYETLGIQADLKPRDYIKHLRERIRLYCAAGLTVDIGFNTGINIIAVNAVVEELKLMIDWIEASARGE